MNVNEKKRGRPARAHSQLSADAILNKAKILMQNRSEERRVGKECRL